MLTSNNSLEAPAKGPVDETLMTTNAKKNPILNNTPLELRVSGETKIDELVEIKLENEEDKQAIFLRV